MATKQTLIQELLRLVDNGLKLCEMYDYTKLSRTSSIKFICERCETPSEKQLMSIVGNQMCKRCNGMLIKTKSVVAPQSHSVAPQSHSVEPLPQMGDIRAGAYTKARNTMKQKYGVEYPTQSIVIKNKIKETVRNTNLDKHRLIVDFIKTNGVAPSGTSADPQQKRLGTFLGRYKQLRKTTPDEMIEQLYRSTGCDKYLNVRVHHSHPVGGATQPVSATPLASASAVSQVDDTLLMNEIVKLFTENDEFTPELKDKIMNMIQKLQPLNKEKKKIKAIINSLNE